MQRIPLFPLDDRRQAVIPPGFRKTVDTGTYEEYEGAAIINGARICRIVVHKGNTAKTILDVLKEYKPITKVIAPVVVNETISCIQMQYKNKTGLIYLFSEYVEQPTPYAHAELTEIINTLESDKRTTVPILFSVEEKDDPACQEHFDAFRSSTSKTNLQKNRRRI